MFVLNGSFLWGNVLELINYFLQLIFDLLAFVIARV